jgi:hypothetical protein
MFRLTIFVCFAVLSASLSAKNYCISLSGDTQSLIEEYPFDRSGQVMNMLEPGDTLFFRQGEYPVASPIRPVKSGTAGKPIVIMAYPGERAVFNGKDLTTIHNSERPIWRSRNGIITIAGVEHLKLIGLEVMNARNIGIAVTDTTTRYIDLINCKTHGSYNSGIGLWYCRHVTVKYCEVTGANDQALRTVQPVRREGPHEAITVAGARNFEIAFNEIHSCEKEGIDCKEVSAHGTIHHNFVHDLPRQGIYADCWFGLLEDVEIYSNVIFGCEWGVAVSAEGRNASMRNIRIHHNLVFENRASGILFGVWGTNGPRENILVYNNTVYHNGSPSHWAGKTGGIDVRSSNISQVSIFNNICSENWAFEIATFCPVNETEEVFKSKKILITNNLIDKPHQVDEEVREFNQVWAWDGQSPVYGRAGFTDPLLFNFSLSKKSPAFKDWIKPQGTKASGFLGAMGKKNEFQPFFPE